MPLHLTDRALDDLLDIEDDSIAMWGRLVAADYLGHFAMAQDMLRQTPGLLRQKQECFGRLWFYRVQKHWLVFTFVGESLYLLTVLHGSMDLPRRLDELEPQLIHEAEEMHRRIRRGDAGL